MSFLRKMSLKLKIILSVVTMTVSTAVGVGAYFIIEGSKAPAVIGDKETSFVTTLKEAPTDGSLPSEHSPEDVIAYSLWKVANSEKFKVITTGTSVASVATQKIANERVVIGDRAMISTVSSGLINLGKQRYYSGDKVFIRDYDKITGVQATWKEQVPECITYDEIITRYGWLPFQANGYIICEETFVNKDGMSVEILGGGNYKVAFDLNCGDDYAPFWYRREILTNASSTIIPEFEKIHVELTVDREYRIIYQDFQEEYVVKSMGVKALTKTDVRDEFIYDDVSFNQEYLSYFEKYSYLAPTEPAGDKKGDDVLTMVVSALTETGGEIPLGVKLSYAGAEFDGNVSLNLSDLKNVKVLAKVGDLSAAYLNDTLYLSLYGVKAKGNVAEIAGLFTKGKESSLDVNEIIRQLNASQVIVDGNDVIIKTSLSLAGIDLSVRFELFKEGEDYSLKKIVGNIPLKEKTLAVTVDKSDVTLKESDVIKDKTAFLTVNSLAETAVELYNAISGNSFKINLAAEVNLSDFTDVNETLTLRGEADFLYNGKYSVSAAVDAEIKGVSATVRILYDGEYVYLSALGLNVKLAADRIFDFISETAEKFGVEKIEIKSDSSTEKLLNVLKTVTLSNGNIISADLSDLLGRLAVIYLKVIKEDAIGARINLLTSSLTATVSKTDYYSLEAPQNCITEQELSNLIDLIKKVYDLSEKNAFNFDLDFSVYKSYVKYLDVFGNVRLNIYNKDRYALEAAGTIVQYEGDAVKYHYLDLVIISEKYFGSGAAEGTVYITYGTNPNDSDSKIKIYLPLKDLLGMASTVAEIAGIDLSFLGDYSTFNFSEIDTSQIANLITGGEGLKNVNLNELINSVSVDKNAVNLKLDLNSLLPQKEGSLVSVKIEDGGEAIGFSLTGLYTEYHSYSDNTLFDINDISLKTEGAEITAPDLNGFYDLSNIDDLVNGLLVTASNKNFAISGTVRMKVLSLINIDVPIDIRVKVANDGAPSIYAKLDLSGLSLLEHKLVSSKQTCLYYEDGYVYIYRKDYKLIGSGDEYNLKVKANTFTGDIVYYLLDLGMGMSDTILNSIKSASTEENYLIDAGKVLNSYSDTGTTFTLNLSLKELTGNGNLGDLSVSLRLEQVLAGEGQNEALVYALTKITSLSVKLVSVIEITTKGDITLSNVSKNANGQYAFTEADMSVLRNYIDGYSYLVDAIYKNGNNSGTVSHTVTVKTGMGIQDKVITGAAGTAITYPVYDEIEYNGERYKFVGWYSDKNLETECNISAIGEDNLTIYAKFSRVV